MSTLNPPIALEKPDNQARVDYIQDYASGKRKPNRQSVALSIFLNAFLPIIALQVQILTTHQNFMKTLRNYGTTVVYNKHLTGQMNIN